MLKKKNKVYFLQKNIKTKRPNNKLDHKKLGLFKIKKVKRLVNFELKLLIIIQIYLVFHISFLKPALSGFLLTSKTEV